MEIKPHSAIPSWYGYVYQGQIAIYYTIKLMNEMLNEKYSTELSDAEKMDMALKFQEYELELEWMEDFSVKHNSEYISYHQVKASDESMNIEYSAIFDVFFKLMSHRNAEEVVKEEEKTEEDNVIGYFHVSDKRIKIPSDSEIFNELSKFTNKLICEYNDLVKLEDDKLLKELGDKNRRTKHSFKKLIYDCKKESEFEFDIKYISEVRAMMNEIRKNVIGKSYTMSDIQSISLVRYSECFNKLSDIENQIIIEIEKYYNKLPMVSGVFSIKRIKEKIFPRYLQLITDHIDERKKDKDVQSINFSVFFDILNNLKEEIDVDYDTYTFRLSIANHMSEYIKGYCDENYSNCIECEKEKECNLVTLMDELSKISNTEMKKLISNITVTRNIYLGKEEFPNHHCLHDTIFDFVKQIKELKLNRTRVTGFKNNSVYWCTADNESSRKSNLFERRMKENASNILDIIFEADCLITLDKNIDFINIDNDFITSLDSKNIEDLSEDIKKKYIEESLNITKQKNIKVIDFEKAKGDFIND